jgi:hypothetical protein
VLDWIADLLFTPTGAAWQLHAVVALIAGIAFGVIAAKVGYPELSPYAAIVGFTIYVGVAIARAVARKRNHSRRLFD